MPAGLITRKSVVQIHPPLLLADETGINIEKELERNKVGIYIYEEEATEWSIKTGIAKEFATVPWREWIDSD